MTPGLELEHNSLLNAKHIYIQLMLRQHGRWDAGNTMWTAKWANQLIEGSVLKSKWHDHATSPFLRIYDTADHYKLLGMYAAVHYDTRSVDSLGQQFLDLLDQASWCHVGMGQIFEAAQVWHGTSQTLVLGHSSEQLAWQEQLEPVSSGLPVLQVQQMWAACMVQVQVMQFVPLRSDG